jgi:hypothetical protein
MNGAIDSGTMPANVSDQALPDLTARLAKDVDDAKKFEK